MHILMWHKLQSKAKKTYFVTNNKKCSMLGEFWLDIYCNIFMYKFSGVGVKTGRGAGEGKALLILNFMLLWF